MIQGPEQIGIPGRMPIMGVEGRILMLDAPVARELGLVPGQVVEAITELRGGQTFMEFAGRRWIILQPYPGWSSGEVRSFEVRLGPKGLLLVPVLGSKGGPSAGATSPGAAPPGAAPPGAPPAPPGSIGSPSGTAGASPTAAGAGMPSAAGAGMPSAAGAGMPSAAGAGAPSAAGQGPAATGAPFPAGATSGVGSTTFPPSAQGPQAPAGDAGRMPAQMPSQEFFRLLRAEIPPPGARLQALQGIMDPSAPPTRDLLSVRAAIESARLFPRTLNGEAIRQSLMLSGLFYESRLAQQQPVPAGDLKRILLQSLQRAPERLTLNAALSGMLEMVERSQVEAVQSFQQHRELSLSWLLLLRGAEGVELSLEHPLEEDETEEGVWFFNAYAESPELGPTWMRAKYSRPGNVDLLLWIPVEQTAALAQGAEEDLRFELAQVGLVLEGFHVMNFERPLPPPAVFEPGHTFSVNV